MVRVRIVSGSHWQDGERYGAGDEFDVSDDVYESLKFRFERLPDKAGREPLIETTEQEEDAAGEALALDEAWACADATDAATELALEHGLWPSDVVGTGLSGRVLVGDVRESLG